MPVGPGIGSGKLLHSLQTVDCTEPPANQTSDHYESLGRVLLQALNVRKVETDPKGSDIDALVHSQRFTPPPIPRWLVMVRVILPLALVAGSLVLLHSGWNVTTLALEWAAGIVASAAVLWLVAWLWVYPLYSEVSLQGFGVVWMLHYRHLLPHQIVAAAVLPRQRAFDDYGKSRPRLIGWPSERFRRLFTLGLLPRGYSLSSERVIFVRCRDQRPLLLVAQDADSLFQAVQGVIPLPKFAP